MVFSGSGDEVKLMLSESDLEHLEISYRMDI